MSPGFTFIYLLLLWLFLIRNWDSLRGISCLHIFFPFFADLFHSNFFLRCFMLQGKRVYWMLEALVLLPTACVGFRKLLSLSESQLFCLLRGIESTRISPSLLPVLTFGGGLPNIGSEEWTGNLRSHFASWVFTQDVNTRVRLTVWYTLMECVLPVLSILCAHHRHRGTRRTHECLSSTPQQLSHPLGGSRSMPVLYKSSPDDSSGQPGLSRCPSTWINRGWWLKLMVSEVGQPPTMFPGLNLQVNEAQKNIPRCVMKC